MFTYNVPTMNSSANLSRSGSEQYVTVLLKAIGTPGTLTIYRANKPTGSNGCLKEKPEKSLAEPFETSFTDFPPVLPY